MAAMWSHKDYVSRTPHGVLTDPCNLLKCSVVTRRRTDRLLGQGSGDPRREVPIRRAQFSFGEGPLRPTSHRRPAGAKCLGQAVEALQRFIEEFFCTPRLRPKARSCSATVMQRTRLMPHGPLRGE